MDQRNQALFIFGHSLAENDSHILNRIGRGKCQKVYISLYGDPGSDDNAEIIQRAEAIAGLRRRSYPMDLNYLTLIHISEPTRPY